MQEKIVSISIDKILSESVETSQSIADFRNVPDRDAYATIRGFVYQVDLTILRWLELHEGQMLELESGEDIDLVDAATTEFPRKRLLEQVKHRDSTITLRSKSVLEAIKNAIVHRENNKTLDITVRFSTNATIGRENKLSTQIPNGIGLLQLWESIRKNENIGISESETIKLIRSQIAKQKKPNQHQTKDFTSWKTLQDFFANPDDTIIKDLICHIEWSTGGPSATSTKTEIQKKLTSLGKATDDTQATELYQRLFLVVFKLLCQKGQKRLTSELLEQVFTTPTLSEADRQILQQLQNSVADHEYRITALEINTLAKQEQISVFDVVPYLPSTSPPFLPDCVAKRQPTIDRVAQEVENASWIAIHGNCSSGKTVFAALLTEQWESESIWIQLDKSSRISAVAFIERALYAIKQQPTGGNHNNWFNDLLSSLEEGATIVIDNLPDLSCNPELKTWLATFFSACRQHKIRLVTIGEYNLPQSFLGGFGPGLIQPALVPQFSQDDVIELLQNSGAPDGFCTKISIDIIYANTSGHPLLVLATAAFLRQQHWNFDANVIIDLLKNPHLNELNDDIIRQLTYSICDNSRDLLYRLKLASYQFRREAVDAVGQVSPEIARYNEIFAELTGPWVNRKSNNTFELSPLITSIKHNLLNQQVAQKCHEALGNLIMQSQCISSIDIMQTISHFDLAGLYDRMAIVFIVALRSLGESTNPSPHEMILSFWTHVRMPETVRPSLRMLARSMQLELRSRLGMDNNDIIANDIHLIYDEIGTNDTLTIIPALFYAYMAFAKSDPCFSHKMLSHALQEFSNWQHTREIVGTDEPIPIEPGMFLLATVDQLKNRTEFEDWLNTLESFPSENIARIAASSDSVLMCIVYIDRFIQKETAKSQSEHDLREILFFLSLVPCKH
ncbi:MAG: hypothetical protein ACRC2T_09170 [Thermoguttaceae bacterium]